MSRFVISSQSQRWLGANFPYATLFVNVLGSLAMGFLFFLLLDRFPINTDLRAFLIIGCLGSFTTFSAFSFETLILLENGEYLRTAIYVSGSIGLCVGGVWLGMLLARQF